MNDYDAYRHGFPSLKVWQHYDEKIALYEKAIKAKYPSLPNPYTWDKRDFRLPILSEVTLIGPGVCPGMVALEFIIKKYKTSFGTTKKIWIQRDA